MQSLGWYLRRLRSMSPAEIAWRARSMLRDQADVIRIPLGILPRLPRQASGTLAEFQPGFTCSPVTRERWSDSTTDALPAWREHLLSKADAILENRLSYFDLENVDHGDPINWHRDHSAGIDAPVRLSVFTDYRDFPTFGDCKLVWEPNRHHQLVVLARAYVASGNTRYAEKIAELLRSWIDANPFGVGMNWKSPLELGVRIINWVWALDLARQALPADDRLWRDVNQSLYLALWDAQRKFSRGSSANNHLIGEAAGVFVGACYFSDFPNAARWAREAQHVLEREIRLQSYDDGCTREHTFAYQFFVIQFFSLCLLAGDASGSPFSDAYRGRLHAMFRFLKELSADTGLPPNVNDNDDGYVLDLGDLPGAPAGLLDVGAAIFDDPDLSSGQPSETVFWLTGKHAASASNAGSSRRSVSFPESGYHLLRSNRLSVFFDCAELGYGSIAAHGHADCLSICLAADGRPVIVDAGCYDYFTHPEWRDYFRETRAHNTAEVDEQSQSQMLGPFLWGRRAIPTFCGWDDDDESTTVAGQHDGYRHLPDPVIHRRELQLGKNDDKLLIVDSLDAKAAHDVRLHFHIEPGRTVRAIDEHRVEIELDTGTLQIACPSGRISLIHADADTRLGWISKSYHSKLPSTCIRVEQRIEGGAEIRTTVTLR